MFRETLIYELGFEINSKNIIFLVSVPKRYYNKQNRFLQQRLVYKFVFQNRQNIDKGLSCSHKFSKNL